MKKILLSLIFLTSSILSFGAFAENYGFLDDAPVSYFTEEDASLYAAAQKDALSNHRDGSKVTWKNPKTSAFGYIIPSNTTRTNGVVCRKITIFNSANKRTGKSTFKFCKINGVWKAAS